jgi:hypothetical protein
MNEHSVEPGGKQPLGSHGQRAAQHGHMGSLADRKFQLLRQAEFYRNNAARAKSELKHAIKPDVMFHSAVDHMTGAIRARVEGLLHPGQHGSGSTTKEAAKVGAAGVGFASLVPLAINLLKMANRYGLLNRRVLHSRWLRPVLGVAAVGGLAYYVQHRRRMVH